MYGLNWLIALYTTKKESVVIKHICKFVIIKRPLYLLTFIMNGGNLERYSSGYVHVCKCPNQLTSAVIWDNYIACRPAQSNAAVVLVRHLCLPTINDEILIAAALLEGDEVTTLEIVFSRDSADEKTEIRADRGLVGPRGKQNTAKTEEPCSNSTCWGNHISPLFFKLRICEMKWLQLMRLIQFNEKVDEGCWENKWK